MASGDAATASHRAIIPAAVSTAFHFVVLLMLGWFASRGGGPDGDDGADVRSVRLATVRRLPDRTQYDAVDPPTPEEVESTEAQSTEAQSTEAAATDPATADASPAGSAVPAGLAPPLDLGGVLADLTATVPAADAGDGSGNAFGPDVGSPGGAASGRPTDSRSKTTLFGVEGYGSSFVYVFDRSDSMNGGGGRPLRAAKRELIRSLRSLSDQQRFGVVFYNDAPTAFDPGVAGGLASGEPAMIRTAVRYVESVRAVGGTDHAAALRYALRSSPDVIFFLTDAHEPPMTEGQLRRITSRAAGGGTSIHAVEFGRNAAAASDTFLRDLARRNGGTYRYLRVDDL